MASAHRSEKEVHDMDTGGFGWTLQTVVGVVILLAALVWALFRNRQSTSDLDRTEAATRDLYREEDEARDPADDDVP
jgi:LPXTG-motif cell wall-anchored protein